MANTLTTWIFVILLGLSADGAREVPYSITGHDGTSLSSLVGDDGICKAMVETQGYVCEEHTVYRTPHLYTIITEFLFLCID